MDLKKFAGLKGKTDNISKDAKKDIENTVKKYSGKSRSQLMEELAKAKKEGLINDQTAKDFLQRFGAMLSPEQRKAAEELLKNL